MKYLISLITLFFALTSSAQVTIENSSSTTTYKVHLNSYDGFDCYYTPTVCYCTIGPNTTTTISLPPGHKAMVVALYTEDDDYLGAETAPLVPAACTFIYDPGAQMEWLSVSLFKISD